MYYSVTFEWLLLYSLLACVECTWFSVLIPPPLSRLKCLLNEFCPEFCVFCVVFKKSNTFYMLYSFTSVPRHIIPKDVFFAKGQEGRRGHGWVFLFGWVDCWPSILICGESRVPVSSLSSRNPVEKGLRKTDEILCHLHPRCLVLIQTFFLRGSAQAWDLPETCLLGCPPPSSQPPLHSWNFWVVCGSESDLCLALLTGRVLLCASEEEQNPGHLGCCPVGGVSH